MVTFCSNPPDKSSVIFVPTRYPNSCVYHMNAQRMTFHNTKNKIGPRIFPPIAIDAPKAPKIGRTVYQNTGSPTPAKGPIIPTFTPWIAASSTSAPFALSSSNASVTPMIGDATYGCVLKNSRCLFSAAIWSSFVVYNFLIAGISENAQPPFCIRS